MNRQRKSYKQKEKENHKLVRNRDKKINIKNESKTGGD